MRIRRASLHNKGTFLGPLNIFLATSLIITMKKNSGIQEQDKTCRRNFFSMSTKKRGTAASGLLFQLNSRIGWNVLLPKILLYVPCMPCILPATSNFRYFFWPDLLPIGITASENSVLLTQKTTPFSPLNGKFLPCLTNYQLYFS